MPGHSALPWKNHDTERNTIVGLSGVTIGEFNALSRIESENIHNTRFVLRAVNSHYEMIESLKAAKRRIPDCAYELIEKIEAAIAKAEGKA